MRRAAVVALTFAMSAPAAAGITLRLESTCRPFSLRVADRTIPVGDRKEIEIPSSDATVSLVSDSCWAAPLKLERDEAKAAIRVWTRATVTGRFAKAPAAREVRGFVQVRGDGNGREFDAATDCRVEETRWSCVAPATEFDLRLAVPGAAPLYFWDVQAAPRQIVDLGPATLVTGPSVAGWVDDPEPKRVTVYVVPSGSSRGEEARVRIASATPNRRGFFQFAALGISEYSITAVRARRSPRTVDVVVSEEREYRLSDALTLSPLATLDVRLTPERAPDGVAWTVVLKRSVDRTTYSHRVAESAATLDGRWSRADLEADTYVLQIQDSRGSVFARREVEVGAGRPALAIAITSVRVEGRITAGDRPLEATLRFTQGDAGSMYVDSDSDGDFSGVLSRPGKWNVLVTPKGSQAQLRGLATEIVSREPAVAEPIEMKLPGGRLKGTIVDELGNAVAGSVLIAPKSGPPSDVVTNDGTFHVIGLKTGDAVLMAYSKGRESGMVPYEIGESGSDSVSIVVRSAAPIRGVVLTNRGEPVPGAIVRAVGNSFRNVREAIAGLSGEFELKIPGDTDRVALVVLAPAYPLRFVSIEPRRTDFAEIVVSPIGASLTIAVRRIPPSPVFLVGGVRVGLAFALYPHGFGPPRELRDRAVELRVAPGTYVICGTDDSDAECREQPVPANASVTFDADDLAPRNRVRGEE